MSCCIIVLGCYRSGSSAVAGILHKLGVHMGDSFDEPTHANTEGYFEDLEFKEIMELKEEFPYKFQLACYINRHEIKYDHWGVKNPKLCLQLNDFTRFISTDSKVIICRRSKEAICSSMAKAVGYSSGDQYQTLVDYYTSQMEANITEYSGPKLEIDFDVMMANPQATVSEIAEFVGVPMTEEALNHVKR